MKTRISTIIFLVVVTALLAAVACGSSSTATPPTQPPPTEKPIKGPPPTETIPQGNPPPVEPEPVAVPAPIEDSSVSLPEDVGGEYTLKITSGLPSGCAQFDGYTVERDGNRFVVEVTNLMPHPSLVVACTAIYGYHEGEISLGSRLDSGQTYTVTINGDLALSFTVQGDTGMAMVEKESPIESIEVAEADDGYTLTIVSRLPKGSSCSRFNGYQIDRRFAGRIEVTVTHREVPEGYMGVCTADLPAVSTEIALGSDFAEDQTYTVSVNGVEASFTVSVDTAGGETGSNEDAAIGTPAPIEDATNVVQAPLVESTVVPPDSADGPYTLKITSGLPSGCTGFSHYLLSVQGNDFFVELLNRIPADQTIACAAIYGYHDGQLTLGDGALSPGETYTVTINGELAHSFTAR